MVFHKKVMMSLVVVAALAALSGCPNAGLTEDLGDDGSSDGILPGQAIVVSSVDDLPEPGADNSGFLYYVSSEETFYFSDGTEYVAIDLTGPVGQDGRNGSSIEWLGERADYPSDPTENQAFFHSGLLTAYIFDGSGWSVLARSGTEIFTGSGSPTQTLGNIGDLYLDTDNGDLYAKDQSGWSVVTNLAGPAGSNGAQGPAGPAGADGSDGAQGPAGQDGSDGSDGATWLTGSGLPGSLPGNQGDLYLNTDTGSIYVLGSGGWSFSFNINGLGRYLVPIRVVANANQPQVTAVEGASVSVNGTPIGTTDAKGRIMYSTSSSDTFTVGVHKKFFVAQTSGTIDPVTVNGVEQQLELPPQIFIPDTENGRIVRIDDMDGTNRTVSSVSVGSFSLTQPTWVTVDYDAGYIYIAEVSTGQADPFIVQLSAFPPRAEDVYYVTDTAPTISAQRLDWGQTQKPDDLWQVAVTTGGLYAVDPFEESDFPSRLAFFDLPRPTFGGLIYTSDPFNDPAMRGVTVLPDGELLVVSAGLVGADSQATLKVGESITDFESGSTTDFVSGRSDLNGTGDDDLNYPTTVHVSRGHQYVYVSDTGSTDPQGTGLSDGAQHRIARYTLGTDGTGTDRANYGTVDGDPADATDNPGEFFHPIVLGVLPDNRIYIMSHFQTELAQPTRRLIRIDSFEEGDASWVVYKPTGEDELTFIYPDYGYTTAQ